MLDLLSLFFVQQPEEPKSYNHPIVVEKIIELHPIYSSCVVTARMYSPFVVPRANAEDIKPKA